MAERKTKSVAVESKAVKGSKKTASATKKRVATKKTTAKRATDTKKTASKPRKAKSNKLSVATENVAEKPQKTLLAVSSVVDKNADHMSDSFIGEYITGIESGRITVGKKVRAMYVDILKPIIQGKDKRFWFDPKAGAKFVRFCHLFCKQTKGEWAGKPLDLELFQKAKYDALLGVKWRDTDYRRFKEVFDVRGRKNGKSCEESAFSIYMTMTEAGAEVYASATTQEQARRVWEQSLEMVEYNPELDKVFTHRLNPRAEIVYKKTHSVFRVLSGAVKNQDGLNVSDAVIDECHNLPSETYSILKQATSARRQPIINIITTAGFVRGGLFDDEYNYCTKVLANQDFDLTVLVLVYELDDIAEMYREECWEKANPALDRIKSREYLRGEVNRAMGDPNHMLTVKTKDFNIVGVENRAWLTAKDIENGAFGMYTEEEISSPDFIKRFDNDYAVFGYDLSRTTDMTAGVILNFDREKRSVIVWVMYWVTKNWITSEQCRASKAPFMAWIDRGLIRVSGTSQIDYRDVAKWFKDMADEHHWYVNDIGYDSYSAVYLVDEMSERWSKDYVQRPVIQGFKSLSLPMQDLYGMLKDGRICYNNNQVLKWNLANVELVQDRNGNYMPDKCGGKSANKIDGVSALLDAIAVMNGKMDFYLPKQS